MTKPISAHQRGHDCHVIVADTINNGVPLRKLTMAHRKKVSLALTDKAARTELMQRCSTKEKAALEKWEGEYQENRAHTKAYTAREREQKVLGCLEEKQQEKVPLTPAERQSTTWLLSRKPEALQNFSAFLKWDKEAKNNSRTYATPCQIKSDEVKRAQLSARVAEGEDGNAGDPGEAKFIVVELSGAHDNLSPAQKDLIRSLRRMNKEARKQVRKLGVQGMLPPGNIITKKLRAIYANTTPKRRMAANGSKKLSAAWNMIKAAVRPLKLQPMNKKIRANQYYKDSPPEKAQAREKKRFGAIMDHKSHHDEGEHEVIVVHVDSEESEPRPFWVSEPYQVSPGNEKMKKIVRTRGRKLIIMSRAVNSRRMHAVGQGKGARLSFQVQLVRRSSKKVLTFPALLASVRKAYGDAAVTAH